MKFLAILMLSSVVAFAQPLTLNDPSMHRGPRPASGSGAFLQQTNLSSGDGPYNDVANRTYGSSIATNSTAFTLNRIAMKLGNFSGAGAIGSLTCLVFHASSNLPIGPVLAASTNVVLNSTLDNTGYPNASTDVNFYFPNFSMTVTNYALVMGSSSAPGTTAIFTVQAESIVGPASACSVSTAPWSTSFTFSNTRWYFICYGF